MAFSGTAEIVLIAALGILVWAVLCVLVFRVLALWLTSENIDRLLLPPSRRWMPSVKKRQVRIASWTGGPDVDSIEFDTSMVSSHRRQSQNTAMPEFIV
jgi:hypothetical protein